MRINNLYTNMVNNPQQVNQNKTTAQVAQAKDPFDIKDTYEPSSARIKTDFGGYDRTGRLTAKKVSAVTDNFTTSKAGEPSKYVVKGISDILGESEGNVTRKLGEAGMQVEDIVKPEIISGLSQDTNVSEQLSRYSMEQRADLMNTLGMNDSEFDGFIDSLKGVK